MLSICYVPNTSESQPEELSSFGYDLGQRHYFFILFRLYSDKRNPRELPYPRRGFSLKVLYSGINHNLISSEKKLRVSDITDYQLVERVIPF